MVMKRGRCLGKGFSLRFGVHGGGSFVLIWVYSTDPDSARVRAMLEKYELSDFGVEDDDNFCRSVMYVRRCRG
jgi:hypothetical protein